MTWLLYILPPCGSWICQLLYCPFLLFYLRVTPASYNSLSFVADLLHFLDSLSLSTFSLPSSLSLSASRVLPVSLLSRKLACAAEHVDASTNRLTAARRLRKEGLFTSGLRAYTQGRRYLGLGLYFFFFQHQDFKPIYNYSTQT